MLSEILLGTVIFLVKKIILVRYLRNIITAPVSYYPPPTIRVGSPNRNSMLNEIFLPLILRIKKRKNSLLSQKIFINEPKKLETVILKNDS